MPFNSNSPTGSTLTAWSTFVTTRALMRICPGLASLLSEDLLLLKDGHCLRPRTDRPAPPGRPASRRVRGNKLADSETLGDNANDIVRRQSPPNTLQLELAHRLDLHGILNHR